MVQEEESLDCVSNCGDSVGCGVCVGLLGFGSRAKVGEGSR